jgi:prepilin-type N-terminal cleavage/methylation domain-containing protein/prepilin-type processing-associated H-X9-DG protein
VGIIELIKLINQLFALVFIKEGFPRRQNPVEYQLNPSFMSNHSNFSVASAAKKAFTLIELLVVIAIIAILASILFPVFGRARENARRSSCQSNLKQIGVAFMQYTQDYDERYPGASGYYITYGGTSVPITWDLTMQPYIKSYQVVTCPSDSVTPTVVIPTLGTVKRSYAYANYLRSIPGGGGTGGAFGNPGRNIASIPAVSSTILLGEIIGQNADGSSPVQLDSYSRFSNFSHVQQLASEAGKNFSNGAPNVAPNVPAGTGGRHLGTDNFLFADGHVKALRVTYPAIPLYNHIGGWVNSDNDIPQG